MLINLYNISVEALKVNDYIVSLFTKYNITNYGELAEQIKNNNEEIKSNIFLCSAANDAVSMLYKQSGHEHLLSFAVPKVEKTPLEIKRIDKLVKASDLPLFVCNPCLIYAVFGYRHIKNGYYEESQKEAIRKEKTMSDLKDSFSKTKIDILQGEIPYLLSFSSGIGDEKYARILASLKFYDSYILELLKNYSNLENPFYYKQKEKLNIVCKNSDEILKYLFNEGYQYVWGSMSQKAKDNILLDENIMAHNQIKLAGIQKVIANYITVDESCDVTSPKVLSKFIVPYGKK